MDHSNRTVEKSLAIRLMELVRALQLIADSLKAVRDGRAHHLVGLSGQLRGLLTERKKTADPLLLHIAKRFDRPLDVFCMPDVDDPTFPADLRETTLLRVMGFPITTRQQLPAQRKLGFSDFLDQKIIFFKGAKYTPRKLIEWYANSAGGAHYSRVFPADFAELLAFNSMGLQPIANVLVQLGDATLRLGRDLLKSIMDLEIHAVLAVPRQSPGVDVNYVFDAVYPGTMMRLSLVLNRQLIPTFFVRGLQGSFARADADRLIDWAAPRHLQASVTIEDDLATAVELAIDGERVGRVRASEPLLVLSEPTNYDTYHNRAADGASQAFQIGVGKVVMVGSEMGPADRARLLLYFEHQRTRVDFQIILYDRGSHGRAAPGTKDMSMTGNVVQAAVSTVLPDFLGQGVEGESGAKSD